LRQRRICSSWSRGVDRARCINVGDLTSGVNVLIRLAHGATGKCSVAIDTVAEVAVFALAALILAGNTGAWIARLRLNNRSAAVVNNFGPILISDKAGWLAATTTVHVNTILVQESRPRVLAAAAERDIGPEGIARH